MSSAYEKGFAAEMVKTAKKRKDRPESGFERFVHHPVTQAVGYGALVGEGAHALAHGGRLGKRLQALAGSRGGRALGDINLGVASAFLGAEGLAALKSYLRRKRSKNQ